jgi:hypothetical protein
VTGNTFFLGCKQPVIIGQNICTRVLRIFSVCVETFCLPTIGIRVVDGMQSILGMAVCAKPNQHGKIRIPVGVLWIRRMTIIAFSNNISEEVVVMRMNII